jgi:tether containing UBX domain for GLUT4
MTGVGFALHQTTIRVRFGDLTQLEKVFPSSSKIRAVYAFVRDALREDIKPIKFVLCAYGLSCRPPSIWSSQIALRATASNPPPRELKVSDPAVRDLTLAELGLAPSSVLHLRFVDDELNRASLFRPFPRLPFALCRAERQHACCPSAPAPAFPSKNGLD